MKFGKQYMAILLLAFTLFYACKKSESTATTIDVPAPVNVTPKDTGCPTLDFTGKYLVHVNSHNEHSGSATTDESFEDTVTITAFSQPYVIIVNNLYHRAKSIKFNMGPGKSYTNPSNGPKCNKYAQGHNTAASDDLWVGNDSIYYRYENGKSPNVERTYTIGKRIK